MSLSVARSTFGVLADARDVRLLAAAVLHPLLIVAAPHWITVGVLFWWCANTVSHNFIHNPFFRDRRANAAFSVTLTMLLGVPQAAWRARHLAHHAERTARLRGAPGLRRDAAAAVALWTTLIVLAPGFTAFVAVPGLALGLFLSHLQGHYEHARGVTGTDGRIYNALFFNDGHHPEHHARPGRHWSELSTAPRAPGRRSRWPAVLRFLDAHPLDVLERLVLRSPWLQRRVLAAHERALRPLLDAEPPIRRAVVVGGGLFPRTAILLRRLLPDAEIVVVDREQESLDRAAALMPDDVRVVHGSFDGAPDADLVVVPLAFVGDREALVRDPPARSLIVHDWLWRRRGRSAIVSALLLKRLNLVSRAA